MDREEQIEETLNPRYLNYLKSVLMAQLLLEANDELKGSEAFRQNIKYQEYPKGQNKNYNASYKPKTQIKLF